MFICLSVPKDLANCCIYMVFFTIELLQGPGKVLVIWGEDTIILPENRQIKKVPLSGYFW